MSYQNLELERQSYLQTDISANPSAGWKTAPLKDVALKLRAGGTPKRGEQDYWQDGTIPFVKIEDITTSNGFISSTQEYITEKGLTQSNAWIVPARSILLSMYASIGEVAINYIPVTTNQAIIAIIPDKTKIDEEFLLYALKYLGKRLVAFNIQTTQKNVSKAIVEDFLIPLPSLLEQRAIACVLQAAQRAIQAYHKEIELERQRKAALMQHLFTHGTNNTESPTKGTRFGRIPEHWQVQPLESGAYVQTGIAKGRKFENKRVITLPYLRVANVQDGYLDLSEIKDIELLESEAERYKLSPGDVVVTEGGDFDKLGRGFVWHGQIPNCVHQNHIFAIRVNRKLLLPEYLSFLIQSHYGKVYFLSVAHKTTNLACINSTKLKAFPALLPTLDEQKEIVNILQACDSKIAALKKELALYEELFRALLDELMSGRLSALPVGEVGNRYDAGGK